MHRKRGSRGFFCLQVARRVPVIVDVIPLNDALGDKHENSFSVQRLLFAVIAFSILSSIGFQFASLPELVKAQALAQADFNAELTNGDEFKQLSIELRLKYSLMKIMYVTCMGSILISVISGIVAKKRWIAKLDTRSARSGGGEVVD